MTPGSGGGIHGAGSTIVTRLAIGGPGRPLWLEIDRRNLARPWLWLRRLGTWRRPVPEIVPESLPLEIVTWIARDVAPLVAVLTLARPRTGLAIDSWCFVHLPATDVLTGVEIVSTSGGIGLVGFAQPWFVPGDQFETAPYAGEAAPAGLAAAAGLAEAIVRLERNVRSHLGSPERLLALPRVGIHDELFLYLEDLELRAYGSLCSGPEPDARRFLGELRALRDSRWYADDERLAVSQARARAREVGELLDESRAAALARLDAWRARHRAAWT